MLPGWEANNSICILFAHNHTNRDGVRWVESFAPTRDGVKTPALEVTWWPRPEFSEVFSVRGRLDSGEEKLSTGAMYLDSSDLELAHDTWLVNYNETLRPDSEQLVGVVFPLVGVPPGATIKSARCVFVIDEVNPPASTSEESLIIYGESSGNAAAPSGSLGDLSARPSTAAKVGWAPEISVVVGDELRTADISSIVQACAH